MAFENRSEWEFEYTASVLAVAAQAQKDYRTSRVKVWEDKKEEVMTKIKETGLTVHENIAEKMSGTYSNNFNSMHGGATVMVDTTLQKDLNECMERIKTHREAAKSYDGWIQVLNANPQSRLKLKHNDWMFFFGK